MRRLQGAGAELFAVFGHFHQVKVWLCCLTWPVTSPVAAVTPAGPSLPAELPPPVTCGHVVTAVWQTPAPAAPGSPWLQGRHELLWFLWFCTSVMTLWHLAAVSLIFHFWLFASPKEEPDVSSSLWQRDTATVVSRELDCQAKPVSVSNVHKIVSVQAAAAANLYMPGSGLLLDLGSWIMQNVRNGLNHQFYPETEFSFLDMVKKLTTTKILMYRWKTPTTSCKYCLQSISEASLGMTKGSPVSLKNIQILI